MTRTAGIIGLGLIGGSFARVCKNAGLRVIGADICPDTRRAAFAAGIADEVSAEPAAVCKADEILIATPVGTFGDIFSAVAGTLSPSAVLFDGGSCKRRAAELAAKHLGAKAGRFVPSHPVAGGEDSGFAASSADLFRGCWTVLCPARSDEDAAAAAKAAWKRAGAQIAVMTTREHDAIFAAVSHLPHLLSFALMESLRADSGGEGALRYAAGGFRDFTRIAGSHPTMWRDICLQNGDELLSASARFRRQLESFEQAIVKKDGAALKNKFAAARALRRKWREDLEK
ncbi:MAG: prephenate dehydrogenase [Gammaproteobacteria bacterium]